MPPGTRPRPRFFVQGSHAEGDVVTLSGGDAHKVTTVLRRRAGDEIEVCDSAGQAFVGRLSIEGHSVHAALLERRSAVTEPRLHLTLAQAIPKGAKMDFVVEKATELGVARIVPLVTERVESAAGGTRVERWRRLAMSASAQSGRRTIPEIVAPTSFGEFVETWGDGCLILPWELAERVPLRERLPARIEGAERVAVVIGPEGGFSHAEVDWARLRGAAVVSLGSRILRTETAGLTVLSALLYEATEL